MFVFVCVFFESFVLRPKEFSLLFSVLFHILPVEARKSVCVLVLLFVFFFFFFFC